MSKNILVIRARTDQESEDIFQRKLSALGDVFVVDQSVLDEALQRREYIAIVLEISAATYSKRTLPDLIQYLMNLQPQARIIAVSISPTWEQARTVLQTGIHDYVPKSVHLGELIEAIKEGLS